MTLHTGRRGPPPPPRDRRAHEARPCRPRARAAARSSWRMPSRDPPSRSTGGPAHRAFVHLCWCGPLRPGRRPPTRRRSCHIRASSMRRAPVQFRFCRSAADSPTRSSPRASLGTVTHMGDMVDALEGWVEAWIAQQPMFFVATAPCAARGHLNLSPKGPAGTFRVLGPHRAAYLDLVGSGAETVAHLRENGASRRDVLRLRRAASHRQAARRSDASCSPATTSSSRCWRSQGSRSRRRVRRGAPSSTSTSAGSRRRAVMGCP